MRKISRAFQDSNRGLVSSILIDFRLAIKSHNLDADSFSVVPIFFKFLMLLTF